MTKEQLVQWQRMVQKVVEDGSVAVEQVHRSIASMPFDQLEKIAAIQKPVQQARNFHDETVGNIYETIRLLNERAGALTRTLLGADDDGAPPPAGGSRAE